MSAEPAESPAILFTEKDIVENFNRLAKPDGRALPKYGKGPKFRTGKCHCGKRCWPYATCADHRALQTIHRQLKALEDEGTIVRTIDGRGTKGGAKWKLSDAAKARNAAEKAARTFRRTDPKVGRNESCPCGSGKKYKICCL